MALDPNSAAAGFAGDLGYSQNKTNGNGSCTCPLPGGCGSLISQRGQLMFNDSYTRASTDPEVIIIYSGNPALLTPVAAAAIGAAVSPTATVFFTNRTVAQNLINAHAAVARSCPLIKITDADIANLTIGIVKLDGTSNLKVNTYNLSDFISPTQFQNNMVEIPEGQWPLGPDTAIAIQFLPPAAGTTTSTVQFTTKTRANVTNLLTDSYAY